MNKPLTLIAATIAMTTLTLAASQAGPLSAGTSALKHSFNASSEHAQIVHKTGKKRKDPKPEKPKALSAEPFFIR